MRSSSYSGQKASWGLTLAAWGGLLFLHVPILIIFLYTLTPDETTYTFPLPGSRSSGLASPSNARTCGGR